MSDDYRLDVIDEDNIYICCGLGCINIGYLAEGCHGCSMKNECCCFMHEFCFVQRDWLTCCDKLPGHHIRVGCMCDACTIKVPSVCCKNQCHCMCLICACGFPPDNEVPCIAACCTIVCGKMEWKLIFKNCVKFGEIKD